MESITTNIHNPYQMASQLLNNIKLSSDSIEMDECYYLYANKNNIDDILITDHQVIWGRRGTGKTTLLKAFIYKVNMISQDPTQYSLYIVMSKIIPTDSELSYITETGNALPVYFFPSCWKKYCAKLKIFIHQENQFWKIMSVLAF